MAVRTWQIGNSMAMGMQQTGDSPMAVGSGHSSINSKVGTGHSYRWNSTKMQLMVNSMAAGTQRTNVNPRAKTKCSYP